MEPQILIEKLCDKYSTNTKGPSQRLFSVLSKSMLPKNLYNLLAFEQSLSLEVLKVISKEIDNIKPLTMALDFPDSASRAPLKNSNGELVYQHFQKFKSTLESLIALSENQLQSNHKKIKASERYFLIDLSKAQEDPFLKDIESKGLIKKHGFYYYLPLAYILYFNNYYGCPFIKFTNPPTLSYLETIKILREQGGIYNNLTLASLTAEKLSKP